MLKRLGGWLRRLFSGDTRASAPDAPSDPQSVDAKAKPADAKANPANAEQAPRRGDPLKPPESGKTIVAPGRASPAPTFWFVPRPARLRFS